MGVWLGDPWQRNGRGLFLLLMGGTRLVAFRDKPHDTLRGSWGTQVDGDFNGALDAGGVGSEAGPWVFGRGGGEAAGDGVAVQVAEFFTVFGGGNRR
jgi:hypothetical protein